MARIKLEKLEKAFPNGQVAAQDVDLDIADGELLVLVGPSGCGKSTTLRMVAGLERPTGGKVYIGDEDVTELPPQERDIAMVFQSYALYPHKTVAENLAFALRVRGTERSVIDARVRRAASVLGLEELLDRKPAQLSGGQRQRVALGRAIVREPKAFLLDEPLSNLDAKLRIQTRTELARMQRDLETTMLYVTHDQEEAMTLGDRIAVMHRGCLQQIASPMEVYRRPANFFVAGFVGSPPMNFLDGELLDGGKVRIDCCPSPLEVQGMANARANRSMLQLGCRPQDVELVGRGDGDVAARVDVIEPLGSALLVHLLVGSGDEAVNLRAVVPPEEAISERDTVGVRFPRKRLHLFDAAGNRIN